MKGSIQHPTVMMEQGERAVRRGLRDVGAVLWFVFIGVPSTALFLVVGCLMFLIAPFQEALWGGWVWLRMSRRGRVMPKHELVRHLGAGRGTLLIEGTTVGWPWSRLWWTDEVVYALSPVAWTPEQQEQDARTREDRLLQLHFTRWEHERYTDLETGRATLIYTYSGFNRPGRLVSAYPHVPSAYVWSGGLDFLQAESEALGEEDDAD